MKIIITLLFLFPTYLFSQNNKTESLKSKLYSHKNDTNKVLAYFDLANSLYVTNPDLARLYCDSSLVLSEKLNFPYGIAESCGWISYFLQNKGKTHEALKYELKALSIREKKGDKKGISTSLNNIGYVYESIGDLKKAAEHYEKCLAIREILGDQNAIANVLNNLGYIYDVSGEKEKAIFYYLRSLALLSKIGDKAGISRQHHNIAGIYSDNGKFDDAIKSIEKALEINTEINNYEGLIANYNTLADNYLKKKLLEKALHFAKLSAEMAIKCNFPNHLKASQLSLYSISLQKGDFKSALKYHLSFSKLKDSLSMADNDKQFAEAEAKYQNEKKQLEINYLNKDNALNKLEIEHKQIKINQQRYGLIFSIVGLLLALTFVLFITKAYREKKKANAIIVAQKDEVEKQKAEIEFQKEIIEHKSKEIHDSINYAKNIQNAILPNLSLYDLFEDSFLIYTPKDVVSGDFYWFEKRDNTIYLAVADCTGH